MIRGYSNSAEFQQPGSFRLRTNLSVLTGSILFYLVGEPVLVWWKSRLVGLSVEYEAFGKIRGKTEQNAGQV